MADIICCWLRLYYTYKASRKATFINTTYTSRHSIILTHAQKYYARIIARTYSTHNIIYSKAIIIFSSVLIQCCCSAMQLHWMDENERHVVLMSGFLYHFPSALFFKYFFYHLPPTKEKTRKKKSNCNR